MKFLKQFKLFENVNEEEIHEICQQYNIINYVINSDGSIDVDGIVNLSDKNLEELPLKFGEVSGDFYCGYNQLTSLKGSPKYIGGGFYCYNNQLKSLEFSPHFIQENFNCQSNKLTSLEGCPQSVGGSFNCKYNQLTSFEGFSSSISGHFFCHDNPIYNIWKLFEEKSLIEYFNEFDCIRGNELIIDRLNAFLDEIGKPNVKNVEGYKNI